MFKKFQLVAQIFGYVTLAFLAIFGLLTLLRVDAARALGLEPPAPQEAQLQPEDVPQTMNYQGTLRDAAGELLNGTYIITFTLYANVTDPPETYLWKEVHSNVVVRMGDFDVVLGDITPLTPDLFIQSDTRYLGVTVDPYAEMIPRQRLSSVPYAAHSTRSDVSNATDMLPPGVVMAWAGTTPPPGWLLCNGSAVSRTQYPDLFEVISTTHGIGDGSTTFNLPDYRGRFLRGVDGDNDTTPVNRDPDSSSRTAMNPGGNTGNNVGSVQADAFQKHTHDYTIYFDRTTGGLVFGGGAFWHDNTITATGERGNSTETRPVNAYVYWIIKY